ncbi:MAG TPA: translation initiation factor [Pirellulales bacterium]|nr:translation initiation factor [Pirellulales bacterium]
MRLFAGTPYDRPPRCDRCGALEEECRCPPLPAPAFKIPPESQNVRLAVEKRKKGKMVTVLRGLSAEGNDLPDLLRQLKSACGTGGTLKEDAIELQGDHTKRAGDLLREIGYRVRP